MCVDDDIKVDQPHVAWSRTCVLTSHIGPQGYLNLSTILRSRRILVSFVAVFCDDIPKNGCEGD